MKTIMLIITSLVMAGTEGSLEINQGVNQVDVEVFKISTGTDPETIILFGIAFVLLYIIAKIVSNIRISGL